MKPTTDQDQLITALRRGEPSAYSEAMAKYSRIVVSVVASMTSNPRDIEEIVQDVFVKAFSAIDKFRPEDGTKLSTWFAHIAFNATVSRLRRYQIPLADEPLEALSEYLDDEDNLPTDDLDLLARALDRLLPEERLAVTLVYYDELSVADAAKVMTLAPAILSSRLYRIRKKLASIIYDLRKE